VKLTHQVRSRHQSSSTQRLLSTRARPPSSSSPDDHSISHRSPRFSSRQNSSSSSSSPSIPTASSSLPATPNPPRSILARIQSTFALSDKASDTGGSSIRKLVQLAKPEGKQLGIAVGLVSQTSYRAGKMQRRTKRGDEGSIEELEGVVWCSRVVMVYSGSAYKGQGS
jgi:hypothetical protein